MNGMNQDEKNREQPKANDVSYNIINPTNEKADTDNRRIDIYGNDFHMFCRNFIETGKGICQEMIFL
jgi:hypothetical protein